MEKLVKGEVVVLPFPFSDLSTSKKRPALVVATIDGDDTILCQITSKAREDSYSVPLASSHFENGSIPIESRIRPNRIFTADKSIVLYKIGSLKLNKIKEVEDKLISIFKKN